MARKSTIARSNAKSSDRSMQAFVSGLELAPSTVGLVFQHLNSLLEAAAEDGLIARNPARGVKGAGQHRWRGRTSDGGAGRSVVRGGRGVVPSGCGAWRRPGATSGRGLGADRRSGAVVGSGVACRSAVEQPSDGSGVRAAEDEVE